MKFNRKSLQFLFLILISINFGCSKSRSMSSITVGDIDIYIKRRVYGLNGDTVWLTTDNSPCGKPSKETDYITNNLRQGDDFQYKIENGKIYIYGESFSLPKTKFPVEIIAKGYEYNPKNPNYDVVKEEGYKTNNLEINISCFSDNF